MRALNKKATEVLNKLTLGMEPGTARKFDKAPGIFMALSVERLFGEFYSLTHYYKQNGDLVPDPDMTFHKTSDGKWLPVTYEQPALGIFQEALVMDENGTIKGIRPRQYNSLLSFAATWMANIKEQQLKG